MKFSPSMSPTAVGFPGVPLLSPPLRKLDTEGPYKRPTTTAPAPTTTPAIPPATFRPTGAAAVDALAAPEDDDPLAPAAMLLPLLLPPVMLLPPAVTMPVSIAPEEEAVPLPTPLTLIVMVGRPPLLLGPAVVIMDITVIAPPLLEPEDEAAAARPLTRVARARNFIVMWVGGW